MNHHCPACGARAVSEPTGTPLRCMRSNCNWRLITLAEWQKMSPFDQGYVWYLQAEWPTSELAGTKNPHAKDTDAWKAFCEGEQRGVLEAQDGEE